jgi:glycosyltransferase involved in cell wall biosynthesis
MRLGSGIPTKLFDVFPLGKPIVATSIGVEGIELTHQENCLIADTPREFADFCCSLLASETERRRLGANARKMALHLYAHERIAQLIKDTLTTAMGSFTA